MTKMTTVSAPRQFASSVLIALVFLLLATTGDPFITRADDSSDASSTPVAVSVSDTGSPVITPQNESSTTIPVLSLPVIATTTNATTTIDTGTAGSSQIDSSTTPDDSSGFMSVSTTTEPTSSSTDLGAEDLLNDASSTDDMDTNASSTDATTTASTTPTIQSGESVALANILNIVNTNFVNATGASVLLNYVDPVTGDIDLRSASSTLTSGALCQEDVCSGSQGATVNLQSDGNIQNAVVLNATTGGNAIDDPGADTATIGTGNAYAGLNLINLANTNIVNSNYLLVTLNAFQGVNGDIVFPSLTNFFNSLTTALSTPSDVSINGTATVSNQVTTTAGTGDNTVASSTNSSISTGQANSSGNVFNQLNANILGGSNVELLFQIQGNWAGQVYGAPAGLTWTQGPNGIYLFNEASGTPTGSAPGSLLASSTGSISNDVNVVALTGQNAIKDANTAVITSGNAEASANVINVANTNIVGQNWILAIINIFGDLKGNIDFGLPNLFAGIQASAPTSVVNGSNITYTISVINNGDAAASDATLIDTFDAQHLVITNPSVPYTTNPDGTITWDLGTIPAGDAEQITYNATVQGAGYSTAMPTSITAVSVPASDASPADNSDSVTVTTEGSGSTEGNEIYNWNWQTSDSALTAASTTDSSEVSPLTLQLTRTPSTTIPNPVSGLAHEELTVYNPESATSTPVVLHDVLSDPSGAELADQTWNIGIVRPHEKVVIQYDARFATSSPRGLYALSSYVVGSDGTTAKFTNNGTISVLPAITNSALSTGSASLEGASSSQSKLAATTTSTSLAHLLGTPKAMAAGLEAATASGIPSEGLLFWAAILLILILLMGAALTLNYYTQRD